jgi:hypothetical protein
MTYNGFFFVAISAEKKKTAKNSKNKKKVLLARYWLAAKSNHSVLGNRHFPLFVDFSIVLFNLFYIFRDYCFPYFFFHATQ